MIHRNGILHWELKILVKIYLGVICTHMVDYCRPPHILCSTQNHSWLCHQLAVWNDLMKSNYSWQSNRSIKILKFCGIGYNKLTTSLNSILISQVTFPEVAGYLSKWNLKDTQDTPQKQALVTQEQLTFAMVLVFC